MELFNRMINELMIVMGYRMAAIHFRYLMCVIRIRDENYIFRL